MKNKSLELNIFCSISKGRISEVKDVLIPSIEEQNTDMKRNLYLINYTARRDIQLKEFNNSKKINLQILNPTKPLGFGDSHNFAFKKVKPKNYFLIINPDISLHRDCIEELIKGWNRKIGIVEARQLPFSHPKDFPQEDIFETNWASGSCILINTKMFEKIGGFDSNFWMYLEDVDLSWKSWINGYSVIQNPKAIAYHFTGVYFSYTPNSYSLEDFWSIRNFLYISFVYWGKRGYIKAKKLLNSVEHYNRGIKLEAIKSFDLLMERGNITRINVPNSLKDRIKIFGYNKFSKYPK